MKKNKGDKLDLSFINEKTIKVFGPLLLLLLGIIFLLIGDLFSNSSPDVGTPSEEETLTFEEDEGEELHESHDHSAKVEDPFDELSSSYLSDKKNVEINGLTFENPKSVNYAVQENINALLNDANEKTLLFNAYGNTSYYYENTYNTKVNLGRDISHSALCDDNRLVAYVSVYELDNPVLYIKDVSSERVEEFFKPKPKETITSLHCHGKHVYFTISPEKGKPYSKAMALTKYLNELKPSESNITVPLSSDTYAYNNEGVYVYLPAKKSLHQINPTSTTVNDIKVKHPADFKKAYRYSLNDSNDVLIDYEDSEGIGHVSLNGIKLEGYNQVIEAYWYNNENALVLDDTILYLYHAPSKTNTVLKNYVQYSIPTTDGVYYLDMIEGLKFIAESK